MPDKQLFANNATTTLNGAITNVATTMTVTDASVFPTLLAPSAGLQSEFTLVTVEDEIIKITAISGNVCTIVRAQEGTTGAAHDDGKFVNAYNTAGSLDSFVQADNDGDRKGADSVNIQPSRAASTEVASGSGAVAIGADTTASGDYAIAIGGAAAASALASGDYSIAIGASNTIAVTASGAASIAVGQGASATQQGNVAIGYYARSTSVNTTAVGDNAQAEDLSGAAAWSASESILGTVVREIDGNWGMTTGDFDNTGGAEPTGTALGDWVTDNQVTWYIFEDTATNDDSSTCVGESSKVTGGDGTVVGSGSISYGNGNGVFGFNNRMAGQDNVLIGSATQGVGRNNTIIGAHGKNYEINDREVTNSTLIGNAAKFSVSYACQTVGTDFLPLEDGLYAGGHTVDEHYTASASEETFFSPPICAGVNAWTAATSYSHGETVTVATGAPTNYSYFARIVGANGHYGTATSHATTEPTWPTTPGGTVADGSITWVCVDRTDIRHYLPDNVRLIPTSCGFIGDQFTTSVTTQPTISYGIVGTLAKWKAAAITTKLTGPYSKSRNTNLSNTEGSKALGAAITSFGDGMTSGRVYWKGIVVETLET